MTTTAEDKLNQIAALIRPVLTPHFETNDTEGGESRESYLGCYGMGEHHHLGLGRAWVLGSDSYCRPYAGGFCEYCDPPLDTQAVREIMAG
ncbi:MAG: hypothetical protein FWG08_04540 [Propionibacteriaceae bacterium]|nr:hypothetical protein [Propionibacteriaceae bacterium]